MDKAISKSDISVVSEKPDWSSLKDKGFFVSFFGEVYPVCTIFPRRYIVYLKLTILLQVRTVTHLV